MDARSVAPEALILSDGKPGHENQSVALCRLLGWRFRVARVGYRSRWRKAAGYGLDWLRLYRRWFDGTVPEGPFCCVVAAGSTTAYPAKVAGRLLGAPVVAILFPRGYRLDFDCVVAPEIDDPPNRPNVVAVPISLSAMAPGTAAESIAEFEARHRQQRPAVGIVLGGPNAVSEMAAEDMRAAIDRIFALLPEHEVWVSTSRRTPEAVEALVEGDDRFAYRLVYRRDPFNPLPAFLDRCDRLFVSSDSVSMLSEAVSGGSARVEVLMNRWKRPGSKFERFVAGLVRRGAVHVFDGSLGTADAKIDLGPAMERVRACISSR